MQNCWWEKPLVISVSKCYFLSRASEVWVAVKSERLCVSSSDPVSAQFWPCPQPPLTGQLWQEAVGWVATGTFLWPSPPALQFALHRSGEVKWGRGKPLMSFSPSSPVVCNGSQMTDVPWEYCPCSSLDTISLNNVVKKKVCIFLWSQY